ncbi:MAG: type II toxin-antitoxin system HicB family antitoxin [Verrucomicrobiota bacterium]
MNELIFEVTQESDGGYVAECLSEDIFTQGDSWEELKKNVIEAIKGFYFDSKMPQKVRLHLVRDEILSAA